MPAPIPTVDQYIAELPEDRREAISKLRNLLRRRIPKGYRESVLSGAITWTIPLERFPETYNGQPLYYAALASKKSHMSLHLMGPYADPVLRRRIEEGFRRSGRKLDMGKACIRFGSVDDLALDVVGEIVAAVPPERYIEIYRKSRGETVRRSAKAAGATRAKSGGRTR